MREYDLRIMFDTGAAIHVCPPWFGDEFPTYNCQGPRPRLHGANGSNIKVFGIRTIYFKLLKNSEIPVGITFVVCDVKEPLVSFSQMLKSGYACSLSSEEKVLQLNESITIPLHQEGQHFYIKPAAFMYDALESELHTVCPLSYSEQPLQLAAGYSQSFTMRRVSGGNQDYWEYF